MKGQRVFLEALLDDAGLFPPEQLDVAQTIARHARAKDGPMAWVLGSVVVGSSKLPEFLRARPGGWALSIVVDSPLVHDGFAAARDAAENGARIAAVEVPLFRGKGADAASRVDDLCTQLTGAGLGSSSLYVEIPLGDREETAYYLGALRNGAREHRLCVFAKVRCGGGLVPPPPALARFILEAAEDTLPFKATAGLHQPIARAAEDGFHHGFLNLVGGAVLAAAGRIGETDLIALLSETDASALHLGEDGFRWRSLAASPEQIARGRRFVHSFGTCSLSEPLDALLELGVLETASV